MNYSEIVLLTKSYKECDIKEFVNHHLNWCGFDHITIYDNDTICCDITELFKNNDKVNVIKVPGKVNHLELVNTHHKNSKYDWQFYIDDDEYLWFDKNKIENINSFLQYLDSKQIKEFGVYWQFISYKTGEQAEDRNQCFTKECFYVPDKPFFTHLKVFVNKLAQNGSFLNPHIYYPYPVQTLTGITKSPNCTRDVSNDFIKLYHYFYRTKKEWEEKLNRIRPDLGKKFKDAKTCNGDELIYNVKDKSMVNV